jgi:hypothetical protein
MFYRWGLGLLALAALASTALPAGAALIPRPPALDPAWPAVGQPLQYLSGADADPQAALITSVPRPPAAIKGALTVPQVQVRVFPPAGASFPATVGYCSETAYPCLVPLP